METKTFSKLTTVDQSSPEPGASKGACRATGEDPGSGGSRRPTIVAPEPEVPEKKPRRKFTAQYKLRILQEADKCCEPGQLGALLRREGLYSSNLSNWRKKRDKGLYKFEIVKQI